MKKFLLRILSLILIAATLTPMLISCKDDPPPEDDEEEEEEEQSGEFFIEAQRTGKESKLILDVTSTDVHSLNSKIIDGEKVKVTGDMLTWDMNAADSITISTVSPVSIGVCHYIEFDIYCTEATGATISIKLEGCKTAQSFVLDTAGTKTVSIRCEEFSVKDPYPPITGITFYHSAENNKKTSFGISSINAVTYTYTLSVPTGVDITDPALYSSMTAYYREYIAGSTSGYANPKYTEHVAEIDSATDAYVSLYNETKHLIGTPGTLFGIPMHGYDSSTGQTEPKCGANIQDFYEIIEAMAYSYGTAGSKYYQSAELLAIMISCLDYGYEFYYGKDIVGGETTYGNWWQWDIGIPMALTNALVILEPSLTLDYLKKILSPFDTLVPHPMGAGANKTWMARCCLLAGALENDAMRICITKDFMSEVFYYVEDLPAGSGGDGGFYKDGSFLQHYDLAYTGGYGINLLNELSNMLYFLQGSCFNYHGDLINNHYNWIFDSYRTVIFGDNMFASVRGREVSRQTRERHCFEVAVISLLKIQAYAPAEIRPSIESLLRYMLINAGQEEFANTIPLPFLDYATQLVTNDSVPLPDPYEITKIFGNMDRAVQHTIKYGVCVAMSSTRIAKYESINGENKNGWYHGDGMIYIYTDGYDYDYNFYWFVDPYRLPGVTNNLAPRKYVNTTVASSNEIAGGVQQGKYGVVAYSLGSIYNPSSHNNAAAATCTANKSYFMFDNEIFCMGSNISDKSGYDVITTVENRNWYNGDTFYVNNALENPTEIETTVNARTMYFSGMGGYVFYGDTQNNVSYAKKENSIQPSVDGPANATKSFLEITISHGIGNTTTGEIENDKYMYAYLPEIGSSQSAEDYANANEITVLACKDNTHAVLENTLGIVACNFFSSGDNDIVKVNSSKTGVTAIESDSPASVMIAANADGSYTISASDPSQSYRFITIYVTFSDATTVISADTGVSTSFDDETFTITINTENSKGSTFNLTVK